MNILIVGAGKLGCRLANILSNDEHDLTVMDIRQSELDKIVIPEVKTLLSNGVEINNLKKVQIDKYDVVIAVTNDDETNLLIAFLSKRLGCSHTIARVRNPELSFQTDYLTLTMDIDLIVNPEQATAFEIQKYLTEERSIHLEEFAGGKVVMADLHVHASSYLSGKKIEELKMEGALMIAALSRDGEIIPSYSQTMIRRTDVLYLVGEKTAVQQFSKQHGLLAQKNEVNHVVVVGGGRTGFFLSKSLSGLGIKVTLVEIDRERCKYLAQRLEKVLIQNADGTHLPFLKEENIFKADCLAAVMSHDEENLILSLLAKQFGVHQIVTKVKQNHYIPIIEQLGIHFAIDPVNITADHILSYIYRQKTTSFSGVLDEKAKIHEVLIQEGMKVTEGSLKDLNLSSKLVIAAVLRKNYVLIPDESTWLKPGDQVIVFFHQYDKQYVDRYFKPANQHIK